MVTGPRGPPPSGDVRLRWSERDLEYEAKSALSEEVTLRQRAGGGAGVARCKAEDYSRKNSPRRGPESERSCGLRKTGEGDV